MATGAGRAGADAIDAAVPGEGPSSMPDKVDWTRHPADVGAARLPRAAVATTIGQRLPVAAARLKRTGLTCAGCGPSVPGRMTIAPADVRVAGRDGSVDSLALRTADRPASDLSRRRRFGNGGRTG